jgi:hypothetical protein
MDAYCVAYLERDPDGEVARVLDGTYRFVVEPAGPLSQRHAYDVAIGVDDDGPRADRVDDDADRPRLTLTADYERWRQLITGTLDVRMAMLLRRLRVSGDLSPLLGGLSSAAPLMDALSAVDTQWR